ncbi:MAG: hypothetical protein ACJA0C_001258 [Candidatus Endobugula sp.]|jgi:hypothetical protein
MMTLIIKTILRTSALLLLLSLGGCTAISVIDVVASTAIDVAAGAIEVTGDAVGAVVDAVTPDDD